MIRFNNSKKTTHSDEDFARMIAKVANVAQVDAIICATETGLFAKLGFANLRPVASILGFQGLYDGISI
jgi:pyruvate kinase